MPLARVVVVVCTRNALRSRLAAAFFDRVTPVGWRATSAGPQPQGAVSRAPLALIAGTDVAELVDPDPPRPPTGRPPAGQLVGIDYDAPRGLRWHLHNGHAGVPMRDELRCAAEDLAKALVDD